MFQLLQIRFIVIVEKSGFNKTVASANILTVSWFEYKIKKFNLYFRNLSLDTLPACHRCEPVVNRLLNEPITYERLVWMNQWLMWRVVKYQSQFLFPYPTFSRVSSRCDCVSWASMFTSKNLRQVCCSHCWNASRTRDLSSAPRKQA